MMAEPKRLSVACSKRISSAYTIPHTGDCFNSNYKHIGAFFYVGDDINVPFDDAVEVLKALSENNWRFIADLPYIKEHFENTDLRAQGLARYLKAEYYALSIGISGIDDWAAMLNGYLGQYLRKYAQIEGIGTAKCRWMPKIHFFGGE